jgi:hypothetical protein
MSTQVQSGYYRTPIEEKRRRAYPGQLVGGLGGWQISQVTQDFAQVTSVGGAVSQSNLSYGSVPATTYSGPLVLAHGSEEFTPTSLLEDVKELLSPLPGFEGDDSVARSPETVGSAVGVYFRLFVESEQKFGRPIPPPSIEAGPRGSVDLHWEFQEYEAVVNCPEAGRGDLDLYCTNHTTDRLRLKGAPEAISAALLGWMDARWAGLIHQTQ